MWDRKFYHSILSETENPKFTPLTRTTSILVIFLLELPPPPPVGGGGVVSPTGGAMKVSKKKMVCFVSRCVIHLTLHFAFVLRLWSLYEPLANQTEDFLSWRYDLTVNKSVIFLLWTDTVNTRTWEPNI